MRSGKGSSCVHKVKLPKLYNATLIKFLNAASFVNWRDWCSVRLQVHYSTVKKLPRTKLNHLRISAFPFFVVQKFPAEEIPQTSPCIIARVTFDTDFSPFQPFFLRPWYCVLVPGETKHPLVYVLQSCFTKFKEKEAKKKLEIKFGSGGGSSF